MVTMNKRLPRKSEGNFTDAGRKIFCAAMSHKKEATLGRTWQL
jgi:hypothetical protein